jgi:hypothetical protein
MPNLWVTTKGMKTLSSKIIQSLLPSILFLAALIASHSAKADSRDALDFPSAIKGLSIPNASFVNDTQTIIRGAAPVGGKVIELKKMGVTDVVIFKNQTGKEVDKEQADLQKAEINTYPIAFLWKDVSNDQAACEQTIAALKVLVEVQESQDRKAYFHCTAGQDRAGYLAGLYRLLTEQVSQEEVIQQELCANGYSEGNPNKPADVVREVNENLSPLFLTMASMIADGEISAGHLDPIVCRNLQLVKHEVKLCKS